MMEFVNLGDYYVLSDENGCIMEKNGEAFLENKETGEIVKVNYSEIEKTMVQQADESTENMPVAQMNKISVPITASTAVLVAQKWSEAQTSCMLELYADYFPQVGPLKKFKNKKAMWAFLGMEIEKKFNVKWSGAQVETKCRCVMKRVKSRNDNNKTSGEVYSESGFQEEVNRIVSMDDSIVPSYVLSAKRFTRKRSISSSSTRSGTITPSAIESINELQTLPATNIELQLTNSESSSSLPGISNESSPTPPPTNNESSPTPPPRPRIRKTAQEKIAEKYFALKQERLERMEALIRETEIKREESRASRHADRMKRLDKWIELQSDKK